MSSPAPPLEGDTIDSYVPHEKPLMFAGGLAVLAHAYTSEGGSWHRPACATLAGLGLFPLAAEWAMPWLYRLTRTCLPGWPLIKKSRRILHEGQALFEDDLILQGKDFVRPTTQFHGLSIPPEDRQPGRFVLLANRGCPWAHRTLITRQLLGLEEAVPLASTESFCGAILPAIATEGWRLEAPLPATLAAAKGCGVDERPFVYEFYLKADPNASGRVTVPTLYDTVANRVVNNESGELLRILDSELRGLGTDPDHAPRLAPGLKLENDAEKGTVYQAHPHDELLEIIYGLNNGVYMCGFAGQRAGYQAGREKVRKALTTMEARLADGRTYLMGESLTECDVRAFPSLLRFDLAYVTFFRVQGVGTLRANYPNVQAYLCRLLRIPAIDSTVDMWSYPTMYGTICKYERRVAGNVVRILQALTTLLLGAARPDAHPLRRGMAALLALPWAALAACPGYE